MCTYNFFTLIYFLKLFSIFDILFLLRILEYDIIYNHMDNIIYYFYQPLKIKLCLCHTKESFCNKYYNISIVRRLRRYVARNNHIFKWNSYAGRENIDIYKLQGIVVSASAMNVILFDFKPQKYSIMSNNYRYNICICVYVIRKDYETYVMKKKVNIIARRLQIICNNVIYNNDLFDGRRSHFSR